MCLINRVNASPMTKDTLIKTIILKKMETIRFFDSYLLKR